MLLETKPVQTLVDEASATVTYIGTADLGYATSQAKWTLQKVVVAGDITTIYYPVGPLKRPSAASIFKWDDRATLNFSLTDDTTAPTLSTVTIASDNANSSALAKVGDTVTLTIIASEFISAPTVTIAGHAAVVTEGIDDLHFTAAYDMVSGDTEGVVTFTIDFTDAGGNPGTQVTAVTGGASVTFDKTAPVATLLYSVNGGTDYFTTLSVKDADTLRIKATFSEALLDSPVVNLAINNSILAATAMTKTSTTVYYYDLNVPVGDVATATCSMSVGTDAAGNVVTAAPVNATFTVDNTAPVFIGVSVLSNNADTARAKSGDIVTAIFTTSSALAANPTVTLGAQAMTFGTLVGSTYTYTRTLDGSETEGTCNALVTGSDIAGNTTTDTNVGNVTSDFTAPTTSSATRVSDTSIDVVLSELALTASITKANAGGFVVTETGGVPTYAVASIAPGVDNTHVVLTVADMSASNVAGVTVTYVAGGNGTVADRAGNVLATDATGEVVAPW